MTWFAQVLHVLRKDLRVIRWGVLLYVLLATLIIAAALLSWGVGASPLWVIALCMLGGLLVGQVVHNDSPASVDSFWATRPLSSSAVFAAKVLMALLLLVVPAVGEWIYLRSHDISAGDAMTLAVQPTAVYLGLLGTALMVAVLTRNIKVFAIAFGALVIAEAQGVQLLFDGESGPVPAPLLYAIVVAG